ncbi:MAG: hypothetical protein B6D41_10555 [Chloroflexi bacterium UTCFX4]|nr:MAG: hypothetical protein B6D41_10555 [Chloroflexi bacterium UTCFX4]
MSGNFLPDTLALAISLFNTMALLWLGLVVLLSAERKSWGIWLAGGGLLLSGVFFLTHTAIIARGLRAATFDLDVLWHFGWLPIITAPLTWYVVMLWYTGQLDALGAARPRWRRLHFIGLTLCLTSALFLCGLILFGGALPTFQQIVLFERAEYARPPGAPLLVGVYAVYNIACIAFSIHALRHPEPSARWLGDVARKRAQPWFTGAGAALLVVSLLVSTFIVILFFYLDTRAVIDETALRNIFAWFDVLVGALIAAAAVAVGKATVSYEIFTGQVLPRRGFLRQWRRALILAAGYSALTATTLTWPLDTVYALLAATLLLVFFYALVAARAFDERERVVAELRPFLQTADAEALDGGRAAFDILIAQVLNARVAYLCPRIPFASALAFPPDAPPPCEQLASLDAQFSEHSPALPIAPTVFHGARWALPLADERGTLGVLLLGERADDSLYTQEEMEIARAAGERITQTQARAELTRRLVALQRERLATTQVIDRRARRALHDDILPQLHLALLNLSAGDANYALTQLQAVHHALSNLLREMPTGAAPQIEKYGLLNALRRAVEDEFASAFDSVTWEIEPRAADAAQTLAALNAETLYAAAREAVRNAAKHGRGQTLHTPLHLTVRALEQNGLVIEIWDDGVGLAKAPNGGGQGLQLHSTLMAVIGGALTLERVGDKTRAQLRSVA